MPKQTPQLPRDIAKMVEKNNLVLAIKTLVEQENISFDDAKNRIDDYEKTLKEQHQAQQTQIIQKQNKKKTNTAIEHLQTDLETHLTKINYQPARFPHWLKRLLLIFSLIILLMLLFSWVFYHH